MIKKVLIANRGAIAVRIIRTLKKMGVQAVVIYSDADKYSLHVALADDAYALGGGSVAQTYLDQNKILRIARDAAVDAIHPGYGFLSENPDFVAACEAADIHFIGPTPAQMNLFALKHEARALAEKNQVPLLPGSELLTDLDDALACAHEIGYPVMVKSTAGGGGIGMQVCESAQQLQQAFAMVKRLGQNNFANDGIFLEKYIAYARHIEVQVFGDGDGKVLTLGERDCSAQRRHQKVIEECPAPNLSDTQRRQLAEVSHRLMSAVKYRNAGTVEFIFDQQTGEFYFLEVNTRLQVEHGVTEMVFAIDLVEMMVSLVANTLPDLDVLARELSPSGHAIQVRVYAEDANKNFQPSAGELSYVAWPEPDVFGEKYPHTQLRIDSWIETGIEVAALYDPMLAKMIVHADDRSTATTALIAAIESSVVEGIESNLNYVKQVLLADTFNEAKIFTRYLNELSYCPATFDVLAAGTQTTVQDFPGRCGYWNIGVPPSGPFDSLSFQLGNQLLGNDSGVAGLEIALSGPTLKFNRDTLVCLTGADFTSTLDGDTFFSWQPTLIKAGQTLTIGRAQENSARAYLLIAGGIDITPYLGSRSTFTLGKFGGFSGRALRTGDVVHLTQTAGIDVVSGRSVDRNIALSIEAFLNSKNTIRVIYGPHGAPDFFTPQDIHTFFNAEWEVHYNSSRTGVRLIGPKPQWARSDGGEAGMHPSNIHDNAYAVGAIDFTGDMPVILGPDGPSLGGFVCPATVIAADLWKLGQLKAGDKIRFCPVSMTRANLLEQLHKRFIEGFANDVTNHTGTISDLTELVKTDSDLCVLPWQVTRLSDNSLIDNDVIIKRLSSTEVGEDVIYRSAGDHYLLVEYGAQALDITLRFRAHALMLKLQAQPIRGVLELTPGIRSLQVHYQPHVISCRELLNRLEGIEKLLGDLSDISVPSRVVHLPLSWNDKACRLAIDKYVQSVRKDAPWCPDNIEFIRRINGLDSVEAVKDIVFSASYLVMGLGDVYLGAPVATPMDPSHRLVTTKYNPARTWTAENSVGIGGSYMCIYGMEGPGGYQFVGRTLQMWNRYRQTKEFTQPWLLRFFDQIRFYPVSERELETIREDFPRGDYPLTIEETTFSLKGYQQFLADKAETIDEFSDARQRAFKQELEEWVRTGQMNFSSDHLHTEAVIDDEIPDGASVVESPVAASIWKNLVHVGDKVVVGQNLCILESMKMEIDVPSPCDGEIVAVYKQEGQQVTAGQTVFVIQECCAEGAGTRQTVAHESTMSDVSDHNPRQQNHLDHQGG